MKRLTCLFCLIALVLSLTLPLASCQKSELTVDEAVAVFEDDIYLVQEYGENMIAPIRENIEKDFAHEVEIVAIVHIINQTTSVPNLEWTYIYEFSDVENAKEFEKNRSNYASSLEGGRCVRFDKIVVFGTSPLIDTIGK